MNEHPKIISNIYTLSQQLGLLQFTRIKNRAADMRSKKRAAGEPVPYSAIAEAVEDPIAQIQSQLCFDGESLATLLKSFQREIESARALDATLPYKFWVKRQFSVGVNEVTRVLERMPPMAGSSEESPSSNLDDGKASRVYLQAIFIASDCNPRWLTKHLPALASSRNVPLIFVKDSKRGSLRLGELIKIKTAIAIGIKGNGNSINHLMEKIILGGKIDDNIEELHSFDK